MPNPLSGEWTNLLRAGGTIAHRDDALDLVLAPRVMLAYDARVTDEVRFSLGASANDPEQLIAWIGKVLVTICASYVQERGVLNVTSGAYAVAEELTPLVNAEMAPMGIELAVTEFDLVLSPDDRTALDDAVEKAMMARLQSS